MKQTTVEIITGNAWENRPILIGNSKMKIYIVSEGALNTGYECSVRCVCETLALAEHIAKAFDVYGLQITEFDVIG